MKKVFVTGATGYIGESLCYALRRRGHQVYALVRPGAKNNDIIESLKRHECFVIEGDITRPETYSDIAKTCSVLIHTAADYANYELVDKSAIDAMFAACAGSLHQKKVIYTSGILVHVSSPDVQDEDTPTQEPNGPVLKHRILNELRVKDNRDVCGVVIRPGFVFGHRSEHFVDYFKQAHATAAAAAASTVSASIGSASTAAQPAATTRTTGTIPTAAGVTAPPTVATGAARVVVRDVNPEFVWSEVHIDDLCDAYLRIVDAPDAVVKGQIFDIADNSRNSHLVIAKAYLGATGLKGEVVVEETKSSSWMNVNVIVSNHKARTLLGWQPLHAPMLDEVHIYYQMWKANQRALIDANIKYSSIASFSSSFSSAPTTATAAAPASRDKK